MKTISEYTELKIPSYALPYLINGDSSGLNDEDIKSIDDYMEQYYTDAKNNNGSVIISTTGNDNDEEYFAWNPEFGRACNVTDCTILIVN